MGMTRKHIGATVDEDLWEEFRQDVKERHGVLDGVLSSELDRALRQYLYTPEGADVYDEVIDMREDIRQIRQAVGTADADGGVVGDPSPSLSEPSDTRPRADGDGPRGPGVEPAADLPDTKPPANQPRGIKAAWIEACLHDTRAEGEQVFTRSAVHHLIDREYGFGDDVTREITDLVVDRLDAVADPTEPESDRFVWGETADQREREAARTESDEVADELDTLTDDADPVA